MQRPPPPSGRIYLLVFQSSDSAYGFSAFLLMALSALWLQNVIIRVNSYKGGICSSSAAPSPRGIGGFRATLQSCSKPTPFGHGAAAVQRSRAVCQPHTQVGGCLSLRVVFWVRRSSERRPVFHSNEKLVFFFCLSPAFIDTLASASLICTHPHRIFFLCCSAVSETTCSRSH